MSPPPTIEAQPAERAGAVAVRSQAGSVGGPTSAAGVSWVTSRTLFGAIALACAALAATSLSLQNAAHFDPWGWIVWGREVLHLDLNTSQGPSWKPGPVVFTTVYALFGSLAPTLWMFTVRFGALMGVGSAFRIAGRISGPLAGVVAAVLVLVMPGFLNGALYGEAEPLMVCFLLLAVEAALANKERSSLVLMLFAGLLRPEVWPLLFAYSGYVWVRRPRSRAWVLASWLLLGLLWFGGDWWGSGNPLLASIRAKQFVQWNARQHFRHPSLETLTLAGGLMDHVSITLAVLALAAAAVRRRWSVIILAAASLVMLLTVAAMAQDGYPVLGRFLFGSTALAFVLSGVGAGEIVHLIGIGLGALRAGRRARAPLVLAAAAGMLAVIAPATVGNARSLRPELRSAQSWADSINTLPRAIAAAGGAARIRGCSGSVTTYVVMASALAWDLHTPMTRELMWSQHPNGIIFIRRHDPLIKVEGHKTLRMHTIATAAGWRVLSVVTRLPAPPGC